ncbi:MAG: radical SAM protein [Clostridiales Family XIII bacterium]|jgi:anaerobic ribonucleoside-triphosphate reductase activating protein|nr:radical SAM protein [Clostridiales Family XIII bacterium]
MIHVAGFVEDSIVDGPGLRTVVFTQGCDKRCRGCHNPAAQPLTGGAPYSPEELFDRITANPLCAGVTFSGGEPLLQAAALLPLARLVKNAGLPLAVYTGDVLEQALERGDEAQLALLALTDVLVDGPFVMEEKTLSLPFRGSKNQRVLDSARSVSERRAVLCEDAAWL